MESTAGGSSSSADVDARSDFGRYLEQVHRYNFEGKRFYHPPLVKEWMRQKTDSSVPLLSNADRLLNEVYSSEADRFQPIHAKDIENNLLVLAILLHPDMQCGHYIHIFRKHIADGHLHLKDLTDVYDSIVTELEFEGKSLPSKWRTQGYQACTEAFEKQRWAFSPVLFHLNMDINVPHASSILPFCSTSPINNKGGTAGVYEYRIQHDLVSDPDLHNALQDSVVEDAEFGKCYELAVKSYGANWDDIYKIESEAFKGIRGLKGVVKYLGEYQLGTSSKHPQTSPSRHIMLEYGELDLDEYLADNYPPVLNEEIIAFWEGLFTVADTLKRIHHLRDDRDQFYRGWHGDVKPDNILRVRGEYKLADFGFAKFIREKPGKTTTFLLGGTRTYGAPECDRRARDGTLTPYSQTIDTWSYGCVLSAVATWVVLGSQAYENYRIRRVMAIKELQQRKKVDKAVSVPSCDDAFHDGRTVLPAVTEWHNYLRNSLRKADTITERILDLIDQSMLISKPDERLTLEQLCSKLDDILILARDRYSKDLDERKLILLSADTLKALLDMDKKAPAKPTAGLKAELQPTRNPGALGVPGEGQDTSTPSPKVRKSERFDKIYFGKTANRQDVLLQKLPAVPGISQSPTQLPSDVVDETPKSLPKRDQEVFNIPDIRVSNSPEQMHSFMSRPTLAISARGVQKLYRPYKPPDNPPSFQNSRNHSQQQSINATQYVENPGVSELPTNIPRTSSAQPKGSVAEFGPNNPKESKDKFHIYGGEEKKDLLPATNQQSLSNSASEPDLKQTSIWRTYESLEKHWINPGTLNRFLGKVPEDPRLKRFIQNRDIIFIVDNAYSMQSHWEAMTTTLLTLAMKIGSLDEDGLDLAYTCGENNQVRGARKWDIPRQFRQSINSAWDVLDPSDKTDMADLLVRIFDAYMEGDMKKKQTLIVLTNGLWEGSKDWHAVEKDIARHINAMRERLGKQERRWFTIQFISFGKNLAALERLEDLDNNLRGLDEDVVDAKPWYVLDVEKLILGSIKEDADAADGLSPISSPTAAENPSRKLSPRLSRFFKQDR